MKAMTTRSIIQRYYESLSKKDDKWKELWSEDAVFADASQTLLAKGKEAVIQSFLPFLNGVAILKVSETLVDGEKACFIITYTYRNAKAETMDQDVAEVWEVRNNKLAKLIIYFDLIAYRNFMRG
jgi:ketosteroid isomerase-like protein